MFDSFSEWDIDVGGVTLHGRSAGTGPPVALLHGHPRTHTTWHQVAPLLLDAGFTVVCPDLRGYGHSSKPEPDADHETYCDRAMATDVATLMGALGHEEFAVVGHDRGSYVAYRCALDHPERVAALAVLDSVPILEALERADARFAELWPHWFFFSTPDAERVITADPLAWYRPDREQMGRENYDDMVAAVSNPATVRAMLEDYRASLHIDRTNDEHDRAAGRTITCPTLVAWSTRDDMETLYGDPSAIWRSWCSGPLVFGTVDSGHHMAEENPHELAALLTDFLSSHQDAVQAERSDVKRDVLELLFAAENARDWKALRALLDPRVEWTLVAATTSVLHGRDAYLRRLQDAYATTPGAHFTVRRWLRSAGGLVVTELVDNEGNVSVDVFDVREGLVLREWEFLLGTEGALPASRRSRPW